MFVSRSEVSAFCSIQRDNRVTGAYAMSASLAGNGAARPRSARTGRVSGPCARSVSTGCQRVAGETCGSSATFRGPTRRSSSGAIDRRQLAAAISRSDALVVTCASFSASANVAAETGGPDAVPVPKVGGAPGVVGGVGPADPGCSRLQAAAAPRTPSGAVIRNCLRVFMAASLPQLTSRLSGS